MIERKRISLKQLLTDARLKSLRRLSVPPTLALYRVAHEGISFGSLEGIGPAPKRWNADMVEKLAKLLDTERVAVYRGHGNGKSSRRPIGHIVKCFTIMENGKISAFALAHITDAKAQKEVLMKKLDTASVEADVEIKASEGAWEVTDVNRAHAVAVADSTQHKPGFELAELISASREKLDEINPVRSAEAELNFQLTSLNLTNEEKEVIARISAEHAKDADAKTLRSYAQACLDTLTWARTAYRKRKEIPMYTARKKFGAPDYSDPDYNELIPQFRP